MRPFYDDSDEDEEEAELGVAIPAQRRKKASAQAQKAKGASGRHRRMADKSDKRWDDDGVRLSDFEEDENIFLV